MVNAFLPRIVRVKIKLPNLPAQWHGRVAALVSDLHLGHIRNGRFIRRIVGTLKVLQPHVVFVAGDAYDGVAANFEKLAEPWAEFLAEANWEFRDGDRETWRRGTDGREQPGLALESTEPSGSRSVSQTALLEADSSEACTTSAGNHEEFYSHAEYFPPMVRAGVQVLSNEKVELDGLQLAGVHYRDAVDPESYREILRGMQLDRNRPTVLLLHAPVQLPIAEQEGVSLQLSGHTHGGQFLPYTWIAKRVWGKFIHGLQRLGNLQVFTSYGAGTWGPPMRVGTRPEIVLIEFSE